MSQDAAPRTLVVAVDFSEMTEFVIEAAAVQAALEPPTVLHATCVLDASLDVLGRPGADAEELGRLEEALRARVAADLEGRGLAVEVHARFGKPPEEILGLAREVKADLIVLGRHAQSGRRPPFLGSVPARILSEARCDVLVVQPQDYPDE